MGLPRTLASMQGRNFYRLMSFSCAMAFLIFGYDAGVLGGVQTTKPFLDALHISDDDLERNPLLIPLIAASYTLGCLFMAITLVCTNFGFRFGRRASIMIGDALVIVGGAIQASSHSVGQICAARVICGFGIGFISATVPTYMAETTIVAQERGPQAAIQCMYLIWGVAFAYWIDLGMTQVKGAYSQVSWRFPISLMCLFCLISLCIMVMLPDTPRWYYAKGRTKDGDKVLSMLYARPIHDPDVQRNKLEILDTLQLEEDEGRINLSDWVWDRSPIQAARRVRTSFLLLLGHQFMGINLVVYYSTVILAQTGLNPLMQSVIAGVANTVFFLGTVFTYFTIERWGRRQLMIWTGIGCIICIAIYLALNSLQHQTKATQWISVAMVIIYEFFIGWGYMGPPWLYGPEVAPLRYRHLAGAAGVVGEWSGCFIIVFGGGTAIGVVGWPIWFWPLGTCVITVLFVYFWCPETAGKSLEEIEQVFIDDAKTWPGPPPRSGDFEVARRWSADMEREKDESAYEIESTKS
ncbi:hypothetical protein LTR78_007758 [Recurvomyces mirabilis]|uniref:Major facilitator superfamily (MFS) profile domain-containing protein n=1 Tax=Recurvomyces mirabilis TaxID=574656 RepID=A0AAE0WI09_9PEZI|nr:hypothetical protein LTR78_007758 [Recurvomyces mirabilis]KAK5151646.1 hypothetical protein LTS14_009133 [Recurvomyces mirabilis]